MAWLLSRLLIVIAVCQTAFPTLIILLRNDLQSVTQSFSIFNPNQSLHYLLNGSYLTRDSGACRESGMDGELVDVPGTYIENLAWETVELRE